MGFLGDPAAALNWEPHAAFDGHWECHLEAKIRKVMTARLFYFLRASFLSRRIVMFPQGHSLAGRGPLVISASHWSHRPRYPEFMRNTRQDLVDRASLVTEFGLRFLASLVTAIWLRFGRFGYDLVTEIMVLVTFWLRTATSRDTFGYVYFGYDLVTSLSKL